MTTSLYDDLERELNVAGPAQALDALCKRLRAERDYANLFYALLTKKRHELGLSPIPTGPSDELPPESHAPYEDGIRAAAREVGRLYLEAGNIPQAYGYFRMIGELGEVTAALERYQPHDGEDVSALVQIAFYEGVQPRRGFDWILQRFGLCSAITTAGSQDQLPQDVRLYCVNKLARALYDELRERLRGDIERREGQAPPAEQSVLQLIAGRDELFVDEFAHVDTSHLSSVVQMSLSLPASDCTPLVRELCTYGERIPKRFQYNTEPPFDEGYKDYNVYLGILQGDKVEEGLRYFRDKVEQAPEEERSFAAEVLVNLYLRLDRTQDALELARRYLTGTEGRQLTCPGVLELCRRAKNYQALAETAKRQHDPVHFLAGLLAAKRT